jgi:hypothetical protein
MKHPRFCLNGSLTHAIVPVEDELFIEEARLLLELEVLIEEREDETDDAAELLVEDRTEDALLEELDIDDADETDEEEAPVHDGCVMLFVSSVTAPILANSLPLIEAPVVMEID